LTQPKVWAGHASAHVLKLLFQLVKIRFLVDKRGISSSLRTVTITFSIGRLCTCAGGLDKNSTDLYYSVSRFNLGGLELGLGS